MHVPKGMFVVEQTIVKYRYIVEMVLNKLRIYANRDEYYQVGLIGLWQALEKFDPAIGALEPYLYLQVRYQIMNELRRKYHQMEKEVQSEELFLFLSTDEGGHAVQTDILALLEELHDEERQLIEYSYFYGYRVKELAEIFGVAEVTIKKRKKRVLNKLRSIFLREM